MKPNCHKHIHVAILHVRALHSRLVKKIAHSRPGHANKRRHATKCTLKVLLHPASLCHPDCYHHIRVPSGQIGDRLCQRQQSAVLCTKAYFMHVLSRPAICTPGICPTARTQTTPYLFTVGPAYFDDTLCTWCWQQN